MHQLRAARSLIFRSSLGLTLSLYIYICNHALAEASGWTSRWKPDAILEFLNKRFHKNTNFKAKPDFSLKIMERYAEVTQRRQNGVTNEEARGDEILASVSALLTKKKRRASFEKGDMGLSR